MVASPIAGRHRQRDQRGRQRDHPERLVGAVGHPTRIPGDQGKGGDGEGDQGGNRQPAGAISGVRRAIGAWGFRTSHRAGSGGGPRFGPQAKAVMAHRIAKSPRLPVAGPVRTLSSAPPLFMANTSRLPPVPVQQQPHRGDQQQARSHPVRAPRRSAPGAASATAHPHLPAAERVVAARPSAAAAVGSPGAVSPAPRAGFHRRRRRR